MGKIIDPGDDILIARPILPGNTFSFELESAPRAIFEVELQVEEDLNGDGETPDTLIQRVPLQLALGRVTTVNLTLRRGEPLPPGTDTGGAADPVFFPEEGAGELLFVTAELSDAAGSKSVFMARRPDATLALDANGNQFVERSERVYPDTELTGWPDPSEQAYVGAVQSFVHEGIVAAVDVSARRLTVRTDTREDITLIVDPFAAIQTLAQNGDVLGQLVLDQSLIGRRVEATGLVVGIDRHANLILVRAEN